MQSTKLNNTQTRFKRILLTVAAALTSGSGWTQDVKALKGRTVNAEGEPIVDAMVNVVEASRIALSDKDGFFTLKNVKPADELYVSSVGYPSTTAIVDLEENFKIVMDADLDEHAHAILLPFNHKPKELVTEPTFIVTGEGLEKHPVTVLQNAFTSTVTGVETHEAQSEPGRSETAMYIRGIRTMNASARSPLIIVDSVERDLSFLDAYPIESITILKDAAVAAVYGVRGVSGVVLVTTRRGEAGKTKIDFTQKVGFQIIAGILESQNSYNYASSRNQVRYLSGLSPEYFDEDLECYRRVCNGEQLEGVVKYKYFNTNWHDIMLRDVAPQYRTNLPVSSNNARACYYVSFSYLRQEGLFDTKWTKWNEGYNTQEVLNRYNLCSDIDIDINKLLNVSMDLGGRIDSISQPGIDAWNLFTWGVGENPLVYPVFYLNDESFMPANSDSRNGATQIIGRGVEQNRRRNLYITVTVTGNLDALVPGLKIKMMFSFDSYETFQKVQQADVNVCYYNYMADANDSSEYTYQRMRTYKALSNATTSPRDYYYNLNMSGGLAYGHTFGKYTVNAQAFTRTYQNVVRGQESSNRYLSYNAQATYVCNNRHIFSGNISRMGNDNYVDGERFGTFPGGSVGWIFPEELWLKNSFVNLLKLRASYGRVGRAVAGVSRYPYQSIFAEGGGYNFGTSQSYTEGVYEPTAGNKNIKWEIPNMASFGADLDLWNKKIYGSADFFKERRSNILASHSTAFSLSGVNVPQDFYGKAETEGFEITLGHSNQIGDFEYYIDGMLTFNINKITEMGELIPDYAYQARTGDRIDQSQSLIWKQQTSNPDLIPESREDVVANLQKYPWNAIGKYKLGNAVFQDTNGDRKIDSYDKVPTGYTNIPELIPTIRLSFSQEGFDARAVLTTYLDRTVPCRENMDYGFDWGGTSTYEITNTWGYYTDDPTDPRNINAKYPRLSISFSDLDRSYPYNESTIWVVNGDFLSLRNVEVGYSLPARLISKVNMTKCRLYLSGCNLCNWSHLPKSFDPENPTNYIWTYPKTRSFTFGVDTGF